jgi:hypothetical protein
MMGRLDQNQERLFYVELSEQDGSKREKDRTPIADRAYSSMSDSEPPADKSEARRYFRVVPAKSGLSMSCARSTRDALIVDVG